MGRCESATHHHMLPNHQRWYAKWKFISNIYRMHTHLCMFGVDLYAQSVLSNKISASELSRKFIKSALLVGRLVILQLVLSYNIHLSLSAFCVSFLCHSDHVASPPREKKKRGRRPWVRRDTSFLALQRTSLSLSLSLSFPNSQPESLVREKRVWNNTTKLYEADYVPSSCSLSLSTQTIFFIPSPPLIRRCKLWLPPHSQKWARLWSG